MEKTATAAFGIDIERISPKHLEFVISFSLSTSPLDKEMIYKKTKIVQGALVQNEEKGLDS